MIDYLIPLMALIISMLVTYLYGQYMRQTGYRMGFRDAVEMEERRAARSEYLKSR